MTCPGEQEATPLAGQGGSSFPRAGRAGGALTQPHVCCRILSLACSPSGASFVCSAAAPSLPSQVDFTVPDVGSKGANQVPGKLLLWDTKTMKQQVWARPVGVPGDGHIACAALCFCVSSLSLLLVPADFCS